MSNWGLDYVGPPARFLDNDGIGVGAAVEVSGNYNCIWNGYSWVVTRRPNPPPKPRFKAEVDSDFMVIILPF